MLRARSPLGVFRGRPPFDRQPARLSYRGPPQPAPEFCGSRRYSEGPGLSVVGGATPGRDTGKRSKVVAKSSLRHSEHAHLLSDIEKLTLPILGSLFPFWSSTGDLVCRLEPTSTG